MPPANLDDARLFDIDHTESMPLLDPAGGGLFENNLSPMARLAGVSNSPYIAGLLRTNRPNHLHRAVAEATGVSETSFFRDEHFFNALHTTILPALIQHRADTRRLRIWSAAASTGQEAFSLAILLADLFPQLEQWDIKIIGTDISRQAIEYAQRGRFRLAEVQRGLAPRILRQYFTPDNDEWAVSPRIASRCDFLCANLCTPLPRLPRFDLILLRNVLLYLPPTDRTAVLANVHRRVDPEGYLVLGSSEQAEDSTDLFHSQLVQSIYLYRPKP